MTQPRNVRPRRWGAGVALAALWLLAALLAGNALAALWLLVGLLTGDDATEERVTRAVATEEGVTHAVLINGGSRPESNYQSHLHLLFFWATWCVPCKKAVPEVMAFAAARGIPVLAITDESSARVAGFLDEHPEEFFSLVATDRLRASFLAYGVSGTPTMVLVGKDGVVRQRQVGYKPGEGLRFKGW